MSFRKRVASFLCAACMLVSILSVSRPAVVYAGSLDDQLQEARDAQAELEKQIEAVQADKSKAIEEKALLDQRNEMLRTEVNLIQQQADETEARITELTEKEKEQYELFCKRVRAMEEAGIPVDERLVCAGEYTQEGGAAAVEKLISQDFTAIFACNDASAYGVCRKLKEYRKKVPEDVSVVGYDDVFYARMLEVPLTTIRQQVREMGREAVRLLLKQIREHKRPESKVIFAPELVVRESTARIQPSQ